MGLEILYGNFCCIPAVTAWGDEFHCHLVFIFDNCFCCFRYFVVMDVFLWHNPGVLQVCHQHSICSGKFVVVSAIDGFDQDCISVYFNHDHYVFVASLGSRGKRTCLVGEYCFANVIHWREYITYFLARELQCVGFFERGLCRLFPCCGFGFC
jgi:hypothetical protein